VQVARPPVDCRRPARRRGSSAWAWRLDALSTLHRLVEPRSTYANDPRCPDHHGGAHGNPGYRSQVIRRPRGRDLSHGACATSLTVAFAPFLGTGTAIPGGTGGVTSFPTQPAISNGNIAFTGAGAGQLGLYLYPPQPVFPPSPIRVGDRTTLIPGGVGTFTSFSSAPIVSGLDISFVGGGANG
jgi:hypothetical protein